VRGRGGSASSWRGEQGRAVPGPPALVPGSRDVLEVHALGDPLKPTSPTTSDGALPEHVGCADPGRPTADLPPNAYGQRAFGRCLSLIHGQTENRLCRNRAARGPDGVVLRPLRSAAARSGALVSEHPEGDRVTKVLRGRDGVLPRPPGTAAHQVHRAWFERELGDRPFPFRPPLKAHPTPRTQ
jgi:hypothetical protein